MRVPVSWLTEHLETDEKFTAEQLADAFVRVGIEVEEVTSLGEVTGPVVVGRVAEIEELTEFKKPIRYCMVEVAEPDDHDAGGPRMRGIVCGATNFVEGDLVVVALPGAVLPGGFAISARKTYGRTSDGMICSARELGLGDEHTGILVLPSGEAGAGDDAVELLGLDESVIELSITPDRGYAFSVRGLARELACALDVQYRDPAAIDVPAAEGVAFPVEIQDPRGLPAVRGPPRHRRRPDRADAVVGAPPAAARRDPVDLADRRRDQLRDARDRPADARVRHPVAARPDHRAPRDRGREAHHARRRRACAGPRRHRGGRRVRARCRSPA